VEDHWSQFVSNRDPALLVPVATTGTNGHYKPGLKAFFPPVRGHPALMVLHGQACFSRPAARYFNICCLYPTNLSLLLPTPCYFNTCYLLQQGRQLAACLPQALTSCSALGGRAGCSSREAGGRQEGKAAGVGVSGDH
jgi:hypothetical protein